MQLPSPVESARFLRERLPERGLFAGHEWRISPTPFALGPTVARELEQLGRVLLQFYRAANLLYRQSAEGLQPGWVATYLDRGKPAELVQLQRAAAFKNELPRVIRPDILLTEEGLAISELDSVPGGIGLTAWLNQAYHALAEHLGLHSPATAEPAPEPNRAPTKTRGEGLSLHGPVIGGPESMLRGFASLFAGAKRVHLVVSQESATYRPEMEWLAEQLRERTGQDVAVRDVDFTGVNEGDAVYRFFELFDLANVPNAPFLFELARDRRIRLTPPPKTFFEEKLLFALLWNRNLRGFWHQHLGESFLDKLLKLIPYTWVMDPAPLPPHAALPELNLTDWHQLKNLSQKQRDLILKVSGFSEDAWGARGVYLGSDLPLDQWSAAVDLALRSFEHNPYVLQRYHKPKTVHTAFADLEAGRLLPMAGRARLCPYYFVAGDADSARAELGGVLATICPADKKIIHGMRDAVLAPCSQLAWPLGPGPNPPPDPA